MREKRGRPLGATAVPLLILVAATTAGCSASESRSAPSAGTGAAAPAASAPPVAGSSADGAASSAASPAASGGTVRYASTGRQLIYTAQLTLRAASVGSAVSRATSIVTASGGYVSGENSSAGNGQPSRTKATVTFKVPAAAYATTLAALSGGGLGTQLSLSQQTQDVTQQVADVTSRVASDRAAITQLRALLRHAGDVSSLLSVQNQINSEESDLEAMLAQQNALDHETSYATVTVTVVGPKAPSAPPAKAAPPPGIAGGLSGGWRALRLTVSWLLTVVGAVAPFATAIAVIGGLAWWGRRRLTRRRRSPAA